MTENVKNYYQGIYLTETVMGNPNGDFVDNSPEILMVEFSQRINA